MTAHFRTKQVSLVYRKCCDFVFPVSISKTRAECIIVTFIPHSLVIVWWLQLGTPICHISGVRWMERGGNEGIMELTKMDRCRNKLHEGTNKSTSGVSRHRLWNHEVLIRYDTQYGRKDVKSTSRWTPLFPWMNKSKYNYLCEYIITRSRKYHSCSYKVSFTSNFVIAILSFYHHFDFFSHFDFLSSFLLLLSLRFPVF